MIQQLQSLAFVSDIQAYIHTTISTRIFIEGLVITSKARKWQPTAVFLPGKCHGQRSLTGYEVAKSWAWLWVTEHTKITQMSFNRWVVILWYIQMVHQCTIDTLKPLIHNILEESPENDAKWKKKNTKKVICLLYDSIYYNLLELKKW